MTAPAAPGFPLAGEYLDRWPKPIGVPVAILSVNDDAKALCLMFRRDGGYDIEFIDLWRIRVVEAIAHSAVQALLRAHVELSKAAVA